jgi:hypothetical protein
VDDKAYAKHLMAQEEKKRIFKKHLDAQKEKDKVMVFVMHSYPELIDVFLAFFSLNGGAECVHGDEYADYAVSILIYVNH